MLRGILICGAPLGLTKFFGMDGSIGETLFIWIGSGLFICLPITFFGIIYAKLYALVVYDDHMKHTFRATNGDEFFDLALCWPFNTDPPSVRVGGMPEPKYNKPYPGAPQYCRKYDPPYSWLFQCPSCGARNPEAHCICWHCGANHTGQHYHYDEQYDPHEHYDPNGVPKAQWQEEGDFRCPTCQGWNYEQYCVCRHCHADWTENGNGEIVAQQEFQWDDSPPPRDDVDFM
jgi:hypothetical protein